MSMQARDQPAYDADFLRAQSGGLSSARKVLSYLFEHYRPASVVDVGCGIGAWPAAARELGTDEIFGIDGAYVDPGLLIIPKERFIAADLEQPLDVRVEAELCICLEVGEHLSAARAASLVGDLTSLAPVVLFGAAIPGVGGVHHVNLQWPSFWMDLFAQHGYVAVDCLRIPFWDDPDVAWCYAQHTLLYCDRARTDVLQLLSTMPQVDPPGLPLVHPGLYGIYLYELEYGSAPSQFRRFRRALERAIGKRVGLGRRWPGPPPTPEWRTRAGNDHHG